MMTDEEPTEHVVRLREDAQGWRRVDGPRLTPEDPFLTGLTEDRAEALVRSNWALQHATVDAAREFYGPSEDEEAEQDTADEPTDSTEDTTSSEDWNEEDWLDPGYQERVADVKEGRVDDHLHDIRDVETSQNVIEAVDERLAEVTDGVHGTQADEEA